MIIENKHLAGIYKTTIVIELDSGIKIEEIIEWSLPESKLFEIK